MRRLVGVLLGLLLLVSLLPGGSPYATAASSSEGDLKVVYQELAKYYMVRISLSIQNEEVPAKNIVENYVRYTLLANGTKPTDKEIADYTNALLSAFEEYVQKQVLSREIYSKLASSGSVPNLTYSEFMEILAKYLPEIYQPYQEYEYHSCLIPIGSELPQFISKDKYLNYFTGVYVYPWPNSIEMSLVFSDEDDIIPRVYDDDARAKIYGSPADIEHFFITFKSFFSEPESITFPGSYFYTLHYCVHGHNFGKKTIDYTRQIYVSDCGHSFAEMPVLGWKYVVWTPKLEYVDGVPKLYYVPFPETLTINGRTIKLTPVPVLIGTYEDADIKERQAYKTTRGMKIVNITINDNSFERIFEENSRWDFPEFQDNKMTLLNLGEPINTKIYFLQLSDNVLPVSVELKIPDLDYDSGDGQRLYEKPIYDKFFRVLGKKYVYEFKMKPVNVYGIHTMYASVEANLLMTRDRDVKAKTFCVLSKPEIKQPTQSVPVFVGSINNPRRFTMQLFLGCAWNNNRGVVREVKVGNKVAKFKYLTTNFLGSAYLLVYPPTQSKPGRYDLTIVLYNGSKIIEKEAVEYSSTGAGKNVDVELVIDRSGSMDGQKIDNAKKAAADFVNLMSMGDYIGIVSFSSSASVDFPLTEINDNTVKLRAIQAIDRIQAGGWTSIGAGLETALQQLVTRGSPNPDYIVLMTDGQENTPPYVRDVLPEIVSRGVKVYTIGFGRDADSQLLSMIARETGCAYYFAPTPEEIRVIYQQISGQVTGKQTLSSKYTKLLPGQSVLQSISIDPTVSSATFVVTWPGSDVNLTLISPDGKRITPKVALNNTNIQYTEGSTYVIYEVKNPVPGEWKMNITAVNVSAGGEKVSTMVLADTNLTIDLFTEKSIYNLGEPINLFGILALNGEPITGEVNATIVRPDGIVDKLQLLKRDNTGVYETYYVPNESGSYTITLSATGKINGVPFTRETTFSVYISSKTTSKDFSISIHGINFTTVSGRTLFLNFTINSTINDNLRIVLTDFTNGTSAIAMNYSFSPAVAVITPKVSLPVYGEITVPFTLRPGIYRGKILVQGSNSALTIPIEIKVTPRLKTAPEDVTLYSTDVGVERIEVYEISEKVLKEITGNLPRLKNSRALLVSSTGVGSFKLRVSDIKGENIKVFRYDFDSKEWKPMSFERGSVILPLSVNGFSLDLVVIGEMTPAQKETSSTSYTDVITLSYLWTAWFLNYYNEFNSLYTNATAMNLSDETLQRALELHNNATALILKAWHTDDINYIKEHLWKHVVFVPQIWNVRKAFLMEREAVNLLKKVLNEYS